MGWWRVRPEQAGGPAEAIDPGEPCHVGESLSQRSGTRDGSSCGLNRGTENTNLQPMSDSMWITLAVTVLSGALLVGCARKPVSDSAGLQPNPPRDQLVNVQEGLPRNSDPGVESEVAKLEGQWVGVSFHIDGLEAPASQWYRYSFDGDRMTTEASLGTPATVRFHLDPHAEPKRLDTAIKVDGVEEISKGIYALDGDSLKLSWRVVGDRPTDFEPRDRDDKIVLVLRRADATKALDNEVPQTVTNWPFKDPENYAVVTVSRILDGSKPILYVVHDEDGDWQFLDGGDVSEDDAKVVSLMQVVGLDPSLKSLADLPTGWKAERRSADQPWERSQR